LGSAAVVINSSGTVRDKHKYQAFGGSDGASVGLGQAYRYTGKPLDEELDLDWYCYGARYYDPSIGRFPSIDPLHGKSPGWSPYGYCMNNPLRYIDPNGGYRIRTDPTRQVIRTENGYSKIGYRVFPMWEGPLNDVSLAVEYFAPFGFVLSLLGEDDSFQILKDAGPAGWEVFSKTRRYKEMARRFPAIKGVGRLLLLYSVYRYLNEYSDPSWVIMEYDAIEKEYGPCLDEQCVQERIRRIVKRHSGATVNDKHRITTDDSVAVQQKSDTDGLFVKT
jgi:RHS repeat-associated protein